MIKIFNLIKSRRPWLPILISHLFNKDFLAFAAPFFTPEVFWFRFHFLFEKSLFVLAKTLRVVSLFSVAVVSTSLERLNSFVHTLCVYWHFISGLLSQYTPSFLNIVLVREVGMHVCVCVCACVCVCVCVCPCPRPSLRYF